jgi:hypothetical protein
MCAPTQLRTMPQIAVHLRSVHCEQHICVFERNDVAPLQIE